MNRTLCVFQARLARLRIGRHPGLLFCPGLEGYRDHTFGGRAGPSVDFMHLLHELGHAAQFGTEDFERRCRPQGFGFRTPQMFMCGRMFDNPATSQATERELQTFAFQLHLARSVGYRFTDAFFIQDSAHVMRLMPDWWHVPGGNEQARKAHCAARIEAHYRQSSAAEVVDRLEAWLDLTVPRLKAERRKGRRPYHQVEPRYRGDGTVRT